MKILTFPYLPKLQHYKKRKPTWLMINTALLGPRFISPHTPPDVAQYARLVSELSDYAKLLLPYAELLASCQDPINQVPYNTGWLAHELSVLSFAQQPRLLAKVLEELLAVGLAVVHDVSSIRTARHSLYARASASLEDSESLALPGEGSGEGRSAGDPLESELPDEIRNVPEDLRIAADHYDVAARAFSWPQVRRATLASLYETFASVTQELRALISSSDEQEFDWLLCFKRASEQPFIPDITGFGFTWFLRTESKAPHRLNALKVWEYAFNKRRGGDPSEGSAQCGECAGCLSGDGCSSSAERRRVLRPTVRVSGNVLRWRDPDAVASSPVQTAFSFTSREVCS